MAKATKKHWEKKNPVAHEAWLAAKKADNRKKAPRLGEAICVCGFKSHDARKLKKHAISCEDNPIGGLYVVGMK